MPSPDETREGATDPDVGCRFQTDNPRPAANRAGLGVGPSPTLGTDRRRAETVSGAAGAVRAAPRENHPSRLAATGQSCVQGLAQ